MTAAELHNVKEKGSYQSQKNEGNETGREKKEDTKEMGPKSALACFLFRKCVSNDSMQQRNNFGRKPGT